MSKQHKNKPLTSKDIADEAFAMYRECFSTDAGQRVLEDLKKSLRHGETLYVKGQTSDDLHYHMGRQSVFNDILFALKKKNV